MNISFLPQQPRLFYCEKCKVYFLSVSKLEKPTHSKCAYHMTRLATKDEIDEVNRVNNTHYVYIEEVSK